MRAKFIRNQDPKDAMSIGEVSHRFALEMVEQEEKLKKERPDSYKTWESDTDDVWRDGDINPDSEALTAYEVWKRVYELEPKRGLYFLEIIKKIIKSGGSIWNNTFSEKPDIN
jgi:hypothetical protein